jgi:chorismate mutase
MSDKKFYLVREDILPDAIRKTARVKELLAQGRVGVGEATAQVGLARSTFYKYREGVFPFFDAQHTKIVNLSLVLRHQPGILSRVLNYVAEQEGNILTINQGLPLQGKANVTIAVDVEMIKVDLEQIIAGLIEMDGVLDTELIGRS